VGEVAPEEKFAGAELVEEGPEAAGAALSPVCCKMAARFLLSSACSLIRPDKGPPSVHLSVFIALFTSP